MANRQSRRFFWASKDTTVFVECICTLAYEKHMVAEQIWGELISMFAPINVLLIDYRAQVFLAAKKVLQGFAWGFPGALLGV